MHDAEVSECWGFFVQILVIHLGDNDATKISSMCPVSKVVRDIPHISQLIPAALLLWVSILSHPVWYGVKREVAIDKTKHNTNRELDGCGVPWKGCLCASLTGGQTRKHAI